MAIKDKKVTLEQLKEAYDVLNAKSSALVLAELPQVGDENIDYYVADEDGLYTHYRWIDEEFKAVGSADSVAMYYRPETLGENDESIKVKSLTINGSVMTITDEEGNSTDVSISGGGGESGGAASITRVTDASTQCVYGGECVLSYIFEATDSAGNNAGNGTGTWYVKGIKKAENVIVRNGENITNTFDIGAYLNAGETNDVILSVSVDIDGVKRTVTKRWSVNAINLYADWTYDETTVNDGDTFTLRWTPYGNTEKVTHLLIDGVEVYKDNEKQAEGIDVTSTNGTARTFTMAKLAHGSHIVSLYLTATVNEQAIQSQTITHSMIFDSGSSVPVVACSLSSETMTQYDTLPIVFSAYVHDQLTAEVTLAVDGTTVDTMTVGREQVTWNYNPSDYGAKVLTITCGTTVKTINVTVSRLEIDNEEISGYDFRLKASELAGNTALQAWSSNGVNATFSSNFDWTNGGIQTELDDSNNPRQYICVKAGTRMTIGFNPLAVDPKINGVDFKIIFKATNCRDYDAKVASCANANGVGISLEAHKATFISTATTVEIPYGEDEYIELEFEAYPKNTDAARYMMAWIDGVIATASVYMEDDGFNPNSNIVIGSDDCDVYVYLVKSYPTVLTRNEHVENFIADAPNAQEMLRRYNRNNVLNQSGEIDYEALADAVPDCRIWLYDIPRMTQSKDDKVYPCGFKQIWHEDDPDYQYYQLEGTGTMSIQGTSSVMYKNGAANTDINFADAELEDSTTVYGELYDGEGNDLMDENLEVKGFRINDNSTPIAYSNTKVNFASCEQVNNMCNAEWYQAFQPYPSLTPRDCMEFSMGVQFLKDQSHTLWNDDNYHMYSIANMGNSKKNTHVFHSSDEVCIEVNNNEAALCLMTTTTGLANVDWKDGSDKTFEFRYPKYKKMSAARLEAVVDGWNRFVTWMATNNPNAATGNELETPETFEPYTFRGHHRTGTQVLKDTTVSQFAGTYTHDTFNYRMAKMLSECEDYLAMDSVVYHFCMMERHTLVDNVAKNTFWSSDDLIHWDLSKAYDMDTSDGNNNEGQMVFDYGNEATDTIGTKTVFNAADSVWFVFVSNLYETCQAMYTDRETAGAWDAQTYRQAFLREQQKVPERVWVQCYWYDYLRTYEEGITTDWMTFLDGGQKTHQRGHYEYFEEKYDASKYMGALAVNDFVTIRASSPSDAEAQGGKLAEAYINAPTTLSMRDLQHLADEDFHVTSYSGLTRLRIENCPNVDSLAMVNAAENLETLRAIGIDWTLSDTSVLDTIAGMSGISEMGFDTDRAVLTGTVHLTGTVSSEKLDEYEDYWSDLIFDTANATLLHRVNYIGFGANGTYDSAHPLAAALVADGANPPNITTGSWTDSDGASQNLVTISDVTDNTNGCVWHFSGWTLDENSSENNPDIFTQTVVHGTLNIFALYTSEAMTYTVRWHDAAGNIVEQDYNVAHNNHPEYNRENPTKDADVQYTYTFAGWATSADATPEDIVNIGSYAVTGNTDFYPVFSTTVNTYTVTWLSDDGETVLDTETYDYGDSPVYKRALPTKAATAQYTYTFAGWANASGRENTDADALAIVTGSRSIYAVFSETLNTYTVTWVNDNGVVLETDTGVRWGDCPSYDGASPESDTKTAEAGYFFLGWSTVEDASVANFDPATDTISGDTVLYAVYAMRTFTVTWKDYDGTDITTTTVTYGHPASYTGSVPEREGTATIAYTFEGWTDSADATTDDIVTLAETSVTGDTAYYAVYSSGAREYTVTWVIDGVSYTNSAAYGTTPVYDGEETIDTDHYWTPAIAAVTGDATYTLSDTRFTGEISDTWEEIAGYIGSSLYSKRYAVGATKALDLGTEGTVSMQIVGFNVDTKASGGTAPITWISKDLLTSTHVMNSSNTNSGGWAATSMRSYLRGTIWGKIPSEVKSRIVEVTKYSYYYDGSANTSSTETVWIPSCREVGFTGYETSGATYSGVFSSSTARVKKRVGASVASYWWLRSAYGSGSSNFRNVNTDGSNNNNNASNSYGVALGSSLVRQSNRQAKSV